MSHLEKAPEKRIVFRMAKRKTKKSTMIWRLTMLGIELKSTEMEILSPLLREINLKGRNIFKILIAFIPASYS